MSSPPKPQRRTRRRSRTAAAAAPGQACVWCSATGSSVTVTVLLGVGGDSRAAPENRVAACAACARARGEMAPAEFALRRLDAGARVDMAGLERALRRLHEARRRVRRHSGEQLTMLACGRLPGETGNNGRRRRLLARDGGGCVWCAKALPAHAPDSTVEHLLPRALGGPDRMENMMCACRNCNQARATTSVAAWVAVCERRGLRPNRAGLLNVLGVLAAERGHAGRMARAELATLGAAAAAKPRIPAPDGPRARRCSPARAYVSRADVAYELAYA